MNVWYKPRLQSVDNIIKTQVLGEQLADLVECGSVVVMI